MSNFGHQLTRFTGDPRHYISHGRGTQDRDSSTAQLHWRPGAPAYILGTGAGHVVCPALAVQADELWALHAHNSMVAAVQEQQSKDKAGDKKKKEKSDRHGPSLVARLESGLLHDQLSGKHFLVDTGATYSVFPHRSSAPPSGPALTGPGGRAISTWGERETPLSFDGQHFTWSFLLAAVQFPILGMDFLQQHGLLVDVGKNQLIMTASMKVIRAVAPSGGPGGLYTAVASSSTGYGPLFAEYVTQHKEESGKPAHRDGLHKGHQSGGPI